MKHRLYKPEQAHSNFDLFEPLKKQLAVKRFAKDADVKQAVTSWLHTLEHCVVTNDTMLYIHNL
jgi:hypothetical protein